MGIINKMFTSVSGLYNNLNPITLSGVNDVIVVKNAFDEYKCSPFQLRFSKLRFMNSKSQVVQVYVNGKLTDITMTITSQGDLFFEEERAMDNVDYEKVIDYLQSNEISVSSILQNRLELPIKIEDPAIKNIEKGIKSMDDLRKSKKYGIKDELIKTKLDAQNTIMSMSNYEISRQDINTVARVETAVDKIVHNTEIDKIRKENLKKRMYAVSNSLFSNQEAYKSLFTGSNNKFSSILNSSEHYSILVEKHKNILRLLESLINNKCTNDSKCQGATVSFSSCLNVKIDKSAEDTFRSYLTNEVECPENTIAKIEGCSKYPISFYFPYLIFVRLFFEVRNSKNRYKKLVEFLEKEHNKTLGWNIFGTKKPIKRDISFSLKLNSAELQSLDLKEGKNDVVFKLSGSNTQLEGNIYLWNNTDRIVISDIDGTITKSDIWGHVYSFMGKDWTHNGVAALYTRIVKNGYKIIYLTARPLGQSSSTKHYLKTVSQDSFTLPDGPVILSPDGVLEAIYREVILKKPEVFKIQCLQTIKELFDNTNPFLAGFGNKVTDVFTYKALEIPNNKIYTINTLGQLQAEYSKSLVGTYTTMNEFIDSIFPNLTASNSELNNHEFSDFSWWRANLK
jgi:phosphatidate phosphatase LPIN